MVGYDLLNIMHIFQITNKTMEHISEIKEAEEFIYNYNWYERKSKNQEDEYKLLKSCEHLALEHKNQKLLCRTRAYLTSYYTQNNKLQEALDLAISNFNNCKNYQLKDELLLMYGFIITIYQLLGDYAQSEYYVIELKDYVLRLDDDKRKFSAFTVSANQNYYTKNFTQCYADYEQALIYAQKLNDDHLMVNLLNNYGYCLIESDLEKAEEVLNRGYKLINSQKNKKRYSIFLGYNYWNTAVLYHKKGQIKGLLNSIKNAIKIFNKNHNTIELLDAKILLAKGYIQTKEFALCKNILIEIEHKAEISSAKAILLKCYQTFYEYYATKKKYKEAFEYSLKFHQLNEQIFNEDAYKKINNLQISHEVKTIKLERENAEKLARIKHDFLANMSHEIRTPINSILGITYLLEQSVLDSKQLNYVKRLHTNSLGLLAIINDILDLSKIEAGKFELVNQPFSLLQSIEEVYEQIEITAREKGIDFYIINKTAWDYDTFHFGDANRLKQVLLNLCSNAIKFTEKGSVVITLSEKTNKTIIEVSDSGIGISKERINNLFQRFEQAEKTTATKFGGTGLGLAISKKLVELMNGKIELDSEPGKGTTFTLSIPFEFATLESKHFIAKNMLDYSLLDNLTILIADDNEQNRITTQELLNHFNPTINIRFAENGKVALNILANSKADIVLMDLDMPEMNGIEATTQIRKIHTNNKLKIIATTASLITSSKEEFLALGFDELIQKPFIPEKFIEIIINILK